MRWLAAALAVVAVVTVGCGDDDGDDQQSVGAFCDAVDQLRADAPFAELEVASPEEMRTAFVELQEGVERIAEAAPEEHAASAERYRDSVDALIDQLRGAGFDPRELDTLAYRSATDEYEAAATSVDNAADHACGG